VLVSSLAVAGAVFAAHGPVGTSVEDGAAPHQARGTLAERVKFKLGHTKIDIKGPVDVITQEVKFAGTNPGPAGNAGWHSHPGAVFVVMRTGTLTVWDEHCVRNEYSAGETFFEAGPHHPMLVKNEGAADATLYVTYIVPVGTTMLRNTEPDRCGVL
jgi:hypothetical protein